MSRLSAVAFAVVAVLVVLASSSSRADEAAPQDCSGDQTQCSFSDGASTKCGTCECEVTSCEGGTLCAALTPEGCRKNASCTPKVDDTNCSCTGDVQDCGCGCKSTQTSGMFGVAGVALAVAAGIAIGRRARRR